MKVLVFGALDITNNLEGALNQRLTELEVRHQMDAEVVAMAFKPTGEMVVLVELRDFSHG